VGDGRLRPRCHHLAHSTNIRVFDSEPFAPLYENMTSSTNRKYITYCTAVRGGHKYAGDMYRKSGEIWTVVFEYASKQT